MTSTSPLPFALLALAACAEARDPSTPPSTDVAVAPIGSAAPTDSTPDAAAGAPVVDDAAADAAVTDADFRSMFGDPIDAAVFSESMTITGLDGGGDRGTPIGLGDVGHPGHAPGTGLSTPHSGSPSTPPRLREGTVSVTGALPQEVVRRIVRDNFGRFRLCYEKGLRKNPTLEGTVVVRFVIDVTGYVASSTAAAGSTLPAPDVVACVAVAVGGLSFPQPISGTVLVSYPITFAPK